MWRYEVRVEACTALGCSSSDWSSVLTLEAPPVGQPAPLLALQPDVHSGLQTTFQLTWSPPSQPNGRLLHYEVHRRLGQTVDAHKSDAAALIYRNISATYKDEALQPYTVYQYQVRYSKFVFSKYSLVSSWQNLNEPISKWKCTHTLLVFLIT